MTAFSTLPRVDLPSRRAHGRSGATVSRWRTAPADASPGGWLCLSSLASRRMRQGRLPHVAGLAACLSSVVFLFWLTLASVPP